MAKSKPPKRKKSRENQQQEELELYGSPVSDKAYDVRLSATAEAAYENFYDLAEAAKLRGDLSNQHITTLRMIDEVLEKIIPRDPFNKKYALQGDLAKIFRYWKGRLRICWMGSSTRRRIYVIFISETLRKEGDVTDPYVLLGRLVKSGQFDSIFDELGMQRPERPSRVQ